MKLVVFSSTPIVLKVVIQLKSKNFLPIIESFLLKDSKVFYRTRLSTKDRRRWRNAV